METKVQRHGGGAKQATFRDKRFVAALWSLRVLLLGLCTVCLCLSFADHPNAGFGGLAAMVGIVSFAYLELSRGT